MGWTIAADHNLLLRVVQRVERMEKLRLSALFACNELHIVDEQHVDRAIAFAKIDNPIVPDSVDHLVHEPLGRDVRQLQIAIVLENVLPDRVHQMCFSQPHAAVDEQGVVGARRRFRHGTACGMSELVRRADDERVEGVAGIETRRSRDRGGSACLECGRFLRSQLDRRIVRRVGEKVHGEIRPFQLGHRFVDDARVVLRQPGFEQPVRNTNRDRCAIVGDERRRPEPGIKTVAVHLRLDARQNFFPEVHVAVKETIR